MRLGLSVLPNTQPCVKRQPTNNSARHGVTMLYVSNLLKHLLLCCPGRKFFVRAGTWMLKLGEVPMNRRTNWDPNLRIALTSKNGGRSDCYFDVSEPITEAQRLSFHYPGAQPDKQTSLVKALFGIQGIKSVHLEPYEIWACWSPVFGFDEMTKQIVRVIREHVSF